MTRQKAMVGFPQAQNCRDILLHRICLLVALFDSLGVSPVLVVIGRRADIGPSAQSDVNVEWPGGLSPPGSPR